MAQIIQRSEEKNIKSDIKALLEFKRGLDRGVRILIIRGGGIGDLLMLTPAIRALRQEFKTAQIDIACQYPEILLGTPIFLPPFHILMR